MSITSLASSAMRTQQKTILDPDLALRRQNHSEYIQSVKAKESQLQSTTHETLKREDAAQPE
jgi:prenyltransferase beta subunit